MKMPSYDGGNIYQQIQRITKEGLHDRDFLERKQNEIQKLHAHSPDKVLVMRNQPGDSQNKVPRLNNQSFGKL